MGKISLRQRIRILERDGYRCVYCGKTSKQAMLQVDHVLARARGGSNLDSNLVAACFECNNGKRADTITPPDHAMYRRCSGDRHPGPYSLESYGPPDAPGRDVALVCGVCHYIVGVIEPTSRYDVGAAL